MPLSKREKWLFAVTIPLIGAPLWLAYALATPTFPTFKSRPFPHPNGASLYLKAANSIVLLSPPVDRMLDANFNIRTPAQKAQFYSLARRKKWLQANAATQKLLHEAFSQTYRFPVAHDDYGEWRGGTPLSRLCRFKYVEAKFYLDGGQAKRALNTSLEAFQIVFDATRGTSYAGRTWERICLREPLKITQKALPLLSAPEAKASLHDLQKLEHRREPMPIAVDDWGREQLSHLRFIMTSPHSTSNWRGIYLNTSFGAPDDGVRSVVQGADLYLLSKTSFVNQIEHFCAHAQREITAPYHQLPLKPIYLTGLVEGFNYIRFTEALTLTHIHFLEIELALQVFKREHGFYPGKLTVLTPQLSQGTLQDPFSLTSADLKYQPKSGNYTLYSVGPDGRDDGKAIEMKDLMTSHEVFPDSKGDIVAGIDN